MTCMDDDGESPAPAGAHGIGEDSLLQAAYEVDGATRAADANDDFADNTAGPGAMLTCIP